jgi:hypothetical protein
MMAIRNRVRGREGLVLAGDLVCFIAYALLGLRSHEDGITLGGVIRAAVPFQIGWLFVNLFLAKPGVGADARQVARLWVPAWALGLVLRTLLFDRTFAVTFAIVALLVNGVLLMIWRSFWALVVLPAGEER